MNNITLNSPRLGVAGQQAASDQASAPTPLASLPAGPGVCIAGSPGRRLYRIVQGQNLKERMAYLQSKTPSPLEIHAWLAGSIEESNARNCHLRHIFREKWDGSGFTLPESDLAEARAYLAEEKDRVAREAERVRVERTMALERAAKEREIALDECVLLIGRLRNLAHVVRCFIGQECRTARQGWPRQRLTDGCLEMVDGFQDAVEELDLGLTLSAMEMRLALLKKQNGRRSK